MAQGLLGPAIKGMEEYEKRTLETLAKLEKTLGIEKGE